jgi:predicted enzyme related to lactoylglutathione lyase
VSERDGSRAAPARWHQVGRLASSKPSSARRASGPPICGSERSGRSGVSSAHLKPCQRSESAHSTCSACSVSVVAPDLERAKSFYAALFGWEYEAGPSRLTTIVTAGTPVATMREDSEPEGASASCWIAYFGVASAHDAQRTAERNGGRTMTAVADGPIGRTALVADRQGATFAVLEQPGRSSSSTAA